MSSETIKIYARIRPPKANRNIQGASAADRVTIEAGAGGDLDGGALPDRLSFSVPREPEAGLINNAKERHDFFFHQVFGPEARQEDVFDRVARPVVDGALAGYNGTVFAYGQTGSGKTFTITGGSERYADRGIIPRAIQYIFRHIAQQRDTQFAIQISYL